MVHHRIQKKKRNKLKPVDPFNKNKAKYREAKRKGKNLVPTGDEQPMPKKLIELQQLTKRYEEEAKQPKKKRTRDHVLEESSKAGFEKRSYEGNKQLVRRVANVTSEEIQESRMLAKFELAGRDVREIEADYKKMDADEKLKKERRKEQEAQRKKKLQKKKAGSKPKPKPAEPEKQEPQPAQQEGETSTAAEVKRASNRKDRVREMKKSSREIANKEMILDAKEVIAFGSRVDAPPQFKGVNRGKLDPLFAKAGGKSLLFKSMLKDEADPEGAERRAKEVAAERTRVIDAYRMFNKAKRLQQMRSS